MGIGKMKEGTAFLSAKYDIMTAMKTKLFACCAAALLICASAMADWTVDDCIDGRCDREIPIYGPGDEMTFTFKLRGFKGLDVSKHTYDWVRTADDGKKETGKAPADRPLILKTSLDRPGFVRYYIELKDETGKTVETKGLRITLPTKAYQ